MRKLLYTSNNIKFGKENKPSEDSTSISQNLYKKTLVTYYK